MSEQTTTIATGDGGHAGPGAPHGGARGLGYVWFAAWPIVRGLLWGATAFGIGAGATSYAMGDHALTGAALSIGYVLALPAWLLGIGAWEAVLRPFFGGAPDWDEGVGVARYFRFNTDPKVIGIQIIVWTATVFGVAGLIAMNMRAELMTPNLDWFSTRAQYNEFMSIHGTLMMFAVATVGIFSGFGHYFVPLQIGARRMLFPRLEAITAWLFPAGFAMIVASIGLGGYQAGWTGYEPLASVDPLGQINYALGSATVIMASSLTAVNIIGTVIFLRCRGLTWARLPIFTWSEFATAFLNWFWFPVIALAMILQVVDRTGGTNFFRGTFPLTPGSFNPVSYAAEGKPLIWQDLFWGFGHPEVYIIMIPAWGIWLEIIPPLARKTLYAYRWAVAGFLGVVLLSSYVWTHHMFVTVKQAREIPFMTTTELISIPTSFMFLAAIGTLWASRPRLRAPLLLVLMSMLNFLVGGISGTFLADVPVNYYVHDTYFVVAHFHYTILGGMIFAWIAGFYYWLPKLSGRSYNERAAKIASWASFVFFNWTFFSMFFLGLNGMNRRVATYPHYLEWQNLWTSIPAFALGASFVAHAVIIGHGWARGRVSEENPWQARTLEWHTSSPPPLHNFEREPVVVSDFYAYGDTGPEPPLLPVPGIKEQPPPEREPVGGGRP